MAVAPMTKAHVLIYGADSDDVVKKIYELGFIQAIEVVEETERKEEVQLQGLSSDLAPQTVELDAKLREVNRSLEILAAYDDSGREVIENFLTLKQRISRDRIASTRKNFDFLELSGRLVELSEKLKHLEDQEGWLQDDINLLNILKPVPFPLSDLQSTTQVKSLLGQLRKENQEAFEKDLAGCEEYVFWEEITIQGQFIYMFLMYYPAALAEQEGADVHSILERHGFDRLDLTRYSLRIPEELQRLTQGLADVRKQIEDVKNQLKNFVRYNEQFKIIEEYLVNEIERYKDLQNFARTEKVYFVEGWMKQGDKNALANGLSEFRNSIEIIYTDADEDDATVPVILENTSYFQPFEVITRMFGMPKYTESDPTPILAPFFALFFGLCLTDAGYGILLALFMRWLMRKYVLGTGTTQLARLLYYGGIATVVCGALTGGWFGDLPDHLPQFLGFMTAMKNALVIIEPLQQPIVFLGFALLLGYIQVCYGIALKMKQRMQRGDSEAALLDEGIWLVFINSLCLWGIISLTAGHLPIGQGLGRMFEVLALFSAGARIWLNDRGNPNVVMRILSGIYSLYDIVGIFSDVLSYSRLLALGLATGVIATVINMLAQMVSSSIPILGIIAGILIFCVGHIFNLTINALGSFIHSGRLQFVEFFSKFFEAGGKKYKPFKFESKYFEITD